jgi:hypothetical protein
LSWPVAVAQASNASIVATFNAANGHLNRDEASIRKAVAAYKRDKRPGPVIAALRHEVRDIRNLNRAIKHESASTAKGRRGKADITKGLTLIANSYATLANEIHQAHSGHPVPPSAVAATQQTANRGRTKLIAGLRLLGEKVKG